MKLNGREIQLNYASTQTKRISSGEKWITKIDLKRKVCFLVIIFISAIIKKKNELIFIIMSCNWNQILLYQISSMSIIFYPEQIFFHVFWSASSIFLSKYLGDTDPSCFSTRSLFFQSVWVLDILLPPFSFMTNYISINNKLLLMHSFWRLISFHILSYRSCHSIIFFYLLFS